MRTPTILATTAGALLLVTLTACGGNSTTADSSAAAPAATPAASGAAAGPPDFTAYRDCMAQNGVTLPDMGQPPAGGAMPTGAPPSGMPAGAPPSGAAGGPGGFALPDGVDQATFDKAQTACASLRPTMGGGRAPARLDETAVAAFKSCMTDHEVTIPSGDNWMTQLDRTDAKVKAAMDTCAPLLPQPGASQ